MRGLRVEVAFGTGYQQYEFQRFGVNLAENRAMFEEALELLTKLLSTENVSHQGRYWTLPETTTLPRPITKPYPQLWRATSSVPTMAWSLARGIKVITGGTASSMDRVINNWHLFQDAVEAARVSWPDVSSSKRASKATRPASSGRVQSSQSANELVASTRPLGPAAAAAASAAAGGKSRTNQDAGLAATPTAATTAPGALPASIASAERT